jgi:hypothetical protein
MDNMSVSAHTRKVLWASAAGRCSNCRRHLIESATAHDDEAIVGEECHIVSAASDGPRHGPPPAGGYDHVTNLLLLCRVCHRLVDVQAGTYSTEALRQMRTRHEEWVRARLRTGGLPTMTVTDLPDRIKLGLVESGHQLGELILHSRDFVFSHDAPSNDDEVELVAHTMDAIMDWELIFSELSPGERLRAEAQLGDLLADELLLAGWVMYGTLVARQLICDGESSPWRSAVISIRRARPADASAA